MTLRLLVRAAFGLALFGVTGCGDDTAPPGPRGAGQLRVGTIVDGLGPGADLSFIDATFARAGVRRQCELTEYGACALFECSGGSTGVRPEAGELTVETADGRFLQRLMPDANGVYGYGDGTGAFVPGDSIGARFAGAEVPAFELGGELPAPIELTEPVPAVGEDLVVARGVDLTLRWTPVTGSVLSVSYDTASPKVLRCSVSSSAGVLTVPAGALGELEEGQLDVRTVRSFGAKAGTYDVVLALMAGVTDLDGQGIRFVLEPLG